MLIHIIKILHNLTPTPPPPPYPREHEINNFGIPFFSHQYFLLSLSYLWPGVEKWFFLKKYVNFTHFTKILSLLWKRGHDFYNFLSPYPRENTYQI